MENPGGPVSLCTSKRGNSKAAIVSESIATESCNSGVLYKLVAAPNVVAGAAAAASSANSASQFADRGQSTSPSADAALSFKHACEQGSSNSPALELKTYPDVKEAIYLSSGLCTVGKANLELEGATSHNFHSISVQPNRLMAHMSETFQKRFIVFDQSGSEKRVFYHPSIVHEFPTLFPNNPNNLGCYPDNLQSTSFRAINQLKETMVTFTSPAAITACEPRLPSHKRDWPSGISGKVCGGTEAFMSRGLEGLSPRSNIAAMVEATNRRSHLNASQDYSGGSHEDTEDLEALLSSDDEMSSTGDSPSDGTCNNVPTLSEDGSREYSCANSEKKRKRELIDYNNEHDTDSSTATSGNVQSKGSKCSHADVSHTEMGSFEYSLLNQDIDSGYSEASDNRLTDETSSMSSATKHGHNLKLQPEQQRPAKRSRKEKIKHTFRLLRGIIPGGHDMDTAFVLDEAIQYVKSLQVKVQKLEAKKLL